MIATSLTAMLLAGAPASCVVPKPAGATADGKPWFYANLVVAFEGRTWVKYGLPRVLGPQEVEQIGIYKGAAVYKERGAATYEVIYVLHVLSDCSFQPYQVKG